MDQSPLYFHLFSTFPEEIRLQIWKDALPGPRIIDLKLTNAKGKLLYKEIRTSQGPWYWNFPSTLTLPSLQSAYVDFKRDIVYRACYQCDPLFQFDLPKDAITNNASTWSYNTKTLARHLSVLQPGRYIQHGAWMRSFSSPEGRKHAIRSLLSVCLNFPALERIWLVVDGRDDRFNGNAEIIDPSTVDQSWDLKFALHTISLIVDNLRTQQPDLNLPRIELGLLMNGEDNEMIERRWCYETAECTFIDPSTGRLVCQTSSPPRVDSVYTYSSGEDEDTDEETTRVVSGCDSPNNGRVEYLDYGRVGGTYHCRSGSE